MSADITLPQKLVEEIRAEEQRGIRFAEDDPTNHDIRTSSSLQMWLHYSDLWFRSRGLELPSARG